MGVHDALVALEWKENIHDGTWRRKPVNIMDQHLSKAKLTLRLLITNTTLYTLATLAVGLQFYTRSRIIRKIVAGDWWILGA